MKKCLIIDGCGSSRFMAELHLQQLGINAVFAANSDEVQHQLIEHHRYIDFILLNWHLAEENSMELLEKIRVHFRSQLPVIVMISEEKHRQDDKQEEKKAYAAQANGVINIPINNVSLHDAIVHANVINKKD